MAEQKQQCPHCAKKTARNDSDKKRLLNRLKRIEGQVRGLQKMLEQDAYCADILTQSAAVKAAVNAFNRDLLALHIHGCVANNIRNGDDSVIDELTGIVEKLMK